MTKILYVLGAISAILLSLYIAVHIPSFSLNTYKNHYARENTAALIGISDEELIAVTQRLLGYMSGTYNDLEIEATVRGETRLFFTQREVDHMADVVILFRGGEIIRNISIALLLISLYFAYKKKEVYTFSKITLIIIAIVIAIILWLVYVFSTDFVGSWWRFHDIFFFNDDQQLWILDPAVDNLVNMVPYSFFSRLAIWVGGIFSGLILAILTLCTGIFIHTKIKNPKER